MTRWQWSREAYVIAVVAVSMVISQGTPRVGAKACPSECQCTQKYYVYCNGIGLTSARLQEILLSVSPEAIFLDLSSNSIERLNPGVLSSVPDLEYLILSDNRIETIGVSVFHYLDKIKELNLTQNRLKEISVNVFVNMPSLQKLHLAGNELQFIQERAFSLPELQQLYLQNNRLTAIKPQQLSGLPSLQHLDLSDNVIQSLEVGAFRDLSALQTLRLSNNRLASLNENVFLGLTSLRRLFLDGNVLPSLDCFNVPSFATTLQALVLSNNSIITIPQYVFSTLQSLKTVALDRNQISGIGPQAFQGLMLDNLTLAYNALEVIERDMFNSVRRISSFDLSHNKINTIRTGAFDTFRESVYVLDLAGNNLGTIHRGMFRVMRNLQELNLSSNALWSIMDGTFQEMPGLSRLDLDHNELQWLSADLLAGPSFQLLSVLRNPLQSLRGFTFNETQGPVSVLVNLTLQSSTVDSITVRWPYEGSQLYWIVQAWCLSHLQGKELHISGVSGGTPDTPDICNSLPQERNIPPYKTSETISNLQADSAYFVCVRPKFLPQDVLVSQCGVVRTQPRAPPTSKPFDPGSHMSSGERGVAQRHFAAYFSVCLSVLMCLLLTRFAVVATPVLDSRVKCCSRIVPV